ncbi:MAG: 7-cyano-7-deazaguanine synthase QueC [Candidatus Eisenbacteria bacterium]|nr:7-cyano-7-deazaguanine synthase QueC [Candidatus Latescibacterota bacterium]MBD3301056.1 7-cyano-7-deazaguanine synthase QueC [Candidatus Eisenbacteria bacterium]
MERIRRSVVLLSGGCDSAVTLALARRECEEVYALTVAYGQRHRVEIDCAAALAASAGATAHRILEVDLSGWGGSSLTGHGPVPKDRTPEEAGAGVPPTYVPARNTILLALALAWAEVLEAEAIYIGVHVQDAGGYPDTRPDYLEAFARTAALATKAGREGRGPEIRAPLLHRAKGEVIALGRDLGVDFARTSSCYDPAPDGAPCGRCDSCRLRASGFREAGVVDPRAAAGEE